MLAIALVCAPAIADVALQLNHPHFGWLHGTRTAFNLDEEMNVPSFFSASGWVVLAGAAAWLTRLSTAVQTRFTWALATVAALFLGADELLSFHENIAGLVGMTSATGFVWQAWAAVYGAAALAGCAAAAPVIWKMAPRERTFLALGALVFLTGAIGFEAIGGMLVADLPYGEIRENAPTSYRIAVIFEESLEMIGLALSLRGIFGQAVLVSAERRARSTALQR
ncbi:MAG: hypothetical protein KJS97_00375 [Alphaproteobacteria bacterium]|nr:hypothetical protein [Alphaproteobacteria bacterium]